jgi:hypothetical protein
MTKAPEIKTTAELIVRTLDLAGIDGLPFESEIGSKQLLLADRIKQKYGEYKDNFNDFSTSAFRARVDVVQEILDVAGLLPPGLELL